MRRFIPFLAFLMAVPLAAVAKPRLSGPAPGYQTQTTTTVVIGIGDTAESDAIGVTGSCRVYYEQASGDDTSLYAIPTASTAATSGTLLRSFTTSTTTTPYEFTPGTKWVKVVATDATAGGSVLTIQCSPMMGGGGGDPDADNDGLYEYAYLWDADGDGSTEVTCTAKDTPDSACKAADEVIYGDLADDLNCALWNCGYGQMENDGTLYLKAGVVYVNFPCWEPTNTVNIRGAANDNTHDSIAGDPLSWALCPATPDADTTRRFTAISLMDWQGEIIGGGVDTRNPATTPNYKRDQGTIIADDRGPYWEASTAQAGNNTWFALTNHIRGFNFGFDAYPAASSDNAPAGETVADGDSDGTTTISGDQTVDGTLGDICVVENSMVTSLQAGDIVVVVGQSGTSSTSTTEIGALRVRTTSTTTDCNGAGTATINIGGQVTSGTGTNYNTTLPDSLTLKSGNYVIHARSDFRDSTARVSNLNFEPQDWWNEPGGDCQETGVWTVALDGDGTTPDIDCDTNDIIGIYGGGAPILEDVVFRNHHGYSIDGNSNVGSPLIRRVRWFYGQGGIIMDPGSGWTMRDLEIHESQFDDRIVAAFGPGVRFSNVLVQNSSFNSFATLTDVNTGNVYENFDFLSNVMTHAFVFTCGARMNEIRDVHISGYLSQPFQSQGSVARFDCASTADPTHDNSISDVWVEGLGPGGNGTSQSHAAVVFDTNSVIGTSNAAAIVRNTFRNFHMNLRYPDANSEACLFGVQDDEPTTSRAVGGDFHHNDVFANNTFFQNNVRHFGGGTDWVYCACGQFDASGNETTHECEDPHTGTSGGGANPRGCGNMDNATAPSNETCS